MFRKPGRTVDRELLDRAILTPCLVCHKLPSDPHHVTTVKAGGGDTLNNVMSLCRQHHSEWHQSGPGTMCFKYPAVYAWLRYHNRDDVLERIDRTKIH
jgi:hypothetical protein